MDHPGEIQLQRYLDGELDEAPEERIRSHLRVCSECRARSDLHARLGEMVRSSVPEPGAFASEGEFWVRISGRLSPRRAPRWPMLPLLPPFLLAALGSTLQVVFTIVVGLFGLGALGLLPAPAAIVAGGIPDVLGHPWLEDTLYAWLGWSGAEVVQSATTRWQAMSATAQHGILLGTTIMGLVAALGAVAVLYLTWAMCWPGAARHETEGGN